MVMRKNICIILVFCIIAFCIAHSEAAKNDRVTFNFVNVDLGAVAKFVSEVTGKNFVFDERLRGKITIIAPSPLKADDAFSLFTSVLKLKGFTLIHSGVDVYQIVPASEARQSGMEITTDRPPINENYIVRLIRLEHISSEEAMRFLKPVISKNGHLSSFGPGNLLLLVDSGLNVQKVLDIIASIDLPPESEEPEVVFLKHSDAETMARMLTDGMRKQPRKGQVGMQAKAVAEPRLNALVLFGTRSQKDAMIRLVGLVDVPAEEEQSTINVYFLENADAEEIAKILQNLTSTKAGGAKKPPGAKGASPFQAVSGLSITPDKATNSLVVIASPSDYKSLVQVIAQLDKRRRQVYVEALIVEAFLDKLRDVGTKWRVAGQEDNEPVVIGGVGNIDTSTMQTILTGLSGLTVGGMGNYMTDVPIIQPDGTTEHLNIPGYAALFSLSEFKGAVNVLSSPQILTSDNTEAEIVVGRNVPFITRKDIATGGTVSNAIERKDVGITLKITPQITEGDYVRLDIYQEISSVKEEAEAQAVEILTSVGPTTIVRSTKTTVVVQDDQTVVISGLMQEEDRESVTRIPLLHRIPLLGWLFKYKTHKKEKTNLLVFITPHVIKDAEGLAEITEKKKFEFAQKEKMYAKGEILVKFSPEVSEETALEIIAKEKATVIKDLGGGIYQLKLRKRQSIKRGIKEFLDHPEVVHAEPNYRLKIQGFGNK
jgi:general secretion pathway protein D